MATIVVRECRGDDTPSLLFLNAWDWEPREFMLELMGMRDTGEAEIITLPCNIVNELVAYYPSELPDDVKNEWVMSGKIFRYNPEE